MPPVFLPGTCKFQDKNISVVAATDNDIILGVYKQYPDASMEEIKKMVGGLMFECGEPNRVNVVPPSGEKSEISKQSDRNDAQTA